jgi:protein-S-isoprenylcysteine O-methyltransferase Ste14
MTARVDLRRKSNVNRMTSLEARIPPPVVALVIALAMWGISRVAPVLPTPAALRLSAAAAILLVGICFSIAGMRAFRNAQTTVNPMRPELASSLVTSGVYRITRNPMYVGLSCDLVAWAVYLSSAWALLGPVAFVLYVGRFQIEPEERTLAKLFGDDYSAYQAKVRRWL